MELRCYDRLDVGATIVSISVSMMTNDYNDLFDADDDLSPHHLLAILLQKNK